MVMMSGHGTVETAVEATRLGAFDFVVKFVLLSQRLITIARSLESGFFFFKQKTEYEISECDWSSDVCSSEPLRFFFFKQKTAYEISECDWSSDVCSSD